MKYRLLPLVAMAAASSSTSFAAVYANADGLNVGTNNTVANGSKSIVAGDSNEASESSLAVGSDVYAEKSSLVVGTSSWTVGGSSNMILGSSHTIDNSYNSVVLGAGSDIYLSNGVGAAGSDHNISAETGSFVAGRMNNLSAPVGVTAYLGAGNVILGQYNAIDKTSLGVQSSVLIGQGNGATSSYAWAIGLGNNAQTNTVTLGTYSNQVADASLIVGTGASGASRNNGLVVLRNGTVSIPSGTLQLGSETAVKPSWLIANDYTKKQKDRVHLLLPRASWLGDLVQQLVATPRLRSGSMPKLIVITPLH